VTGRRKSPLQRRVRGGFSPPSLFIRQLLAGHLLRGKRVARIRWNANKKSGEPELRVEMEAFMPVIGGPCAIGKVIILLDQVIMFF
jgi:hypothetical protein